MTYYLTADQAQAIIADATDAGKGAASWVFDGNTSQENYQMFLQLWNDGDPALHDVYAPRFPLSGEWADDPTVRQLIELHTDLGVVFDEDGYRDHATEDEAYYALEDEVYYLYDDAYQSAYYAELVRVAEYQTREEN